MPPDTDVVPMVTAPAAVVIVQLPATAQGWPLTVVISVPGATPWIAVALVHSAICPAVGVPLTVTFPELELGRLKVTPFRLKLSDVGAPGPESVIVGAPEM